MLHVFLVGGGAIIPYRLNCSYTNLMIDLKGVCKSKFVHYDHIYVPRFNFYGHPKSKMFHFQIAKFWDLLIFKLWTRKELIVFFSEGYQRYPALRLTSFIRYYVIMCVSVFFVNDQAYISWFTYTRQKWKIQLTIKWTSWGWAVPSSDQLKLASN